MLGKRLVRWTRSAVTASSLVLAGCAAVPSGPEGAAPADLLGGCCRNAEAYPNWAAELAFGPPDGQPGLGDTILRAPYIGDRQEVRAVLEQYLRPMDLIVQRYEGRLGGLISPGLFSHATLYLGTEAQLRAAGMWQLPELAPWRAPIAEGNVLLDAIHTDVHLADLSAVLQTDAFAILRPRLSPPERAAALRRGLSLMGRYFDRDFRIETADAIFCTELVHRAMPELGLPLTQVYGRRVILPDAIAAGALLGELPLDVVGYIEGRPGGGVRARSPEDLAHQMSRHWPEPEASGDPARAPEWDAAPPCPQDQSPAG